MLSKTKSSTVLSAAPEAGSEGLLPEACSVQWGRCSLPEVSRFITDCLHFQIIVIHTLQMNTSIKAALARRGSLMLLLMLL